MKTVLLTAVIFFGLTSLVVAQKKDTIMGDMVIGEVVSIDVATREITIKYPGKQGTEIFSGILAEGDKFKIKDISVDEITPGIRVRAFYKSDHVEVSGQKKKIKRITRLQFLGKDEFVRLRDQLKVDPSTAVAHAESADLPATSPIKLYFAIAYSDVEKKLIEWIDKWNQKNGDSYGRLERASNLDQADMLIVTAPGSDTMIAVFPSEYYYQGVPVKGAWSQATSYLVVKSPEGLKVLWSGIALVWSDPNGSTSLKSRELVISEMEKRMKARSGKK